jgi:hypothetical protein
MEPLFLTGLPPAHKRERSKASMWKAVIAEYDALVARLLRPLKGLHQPDPRHPCLLVQVLRFLASLTVLRTCNLGDSFHFTNLVLLTRL